MSDERKRVEHPSWCSREECTAPEFRPTSEEYQSGKSLGWSHYSATVGSRTNDLELFLAEQVCPWETESFLIIRNGHDGGLTQTVPISESGGGFALYELLGQEVKEAVRAYPTLFAERFPYVERQLQDEADEATADAVMPRDPVELEEQMTAEQLEDEEKHVQYKLTVNAKQVLEGTLQDVRTGVAELVTDRLAEAPERVATDAQTINMAFNTGAVEERLDIEGDWYTVLDAYGEEPLRIRITKESGSE
jgi:hypothetical protein